MRPIVRVIGKMLRMVGVSSPEDSLQKPRTVLDLPFVAGSNVVTI
jgi:hypothetical protein